MWALEERVHALGWAAERGLGSGFARAAARDLEALAEFPESGGDELLVVSDDGTLLVGKKQCKKLKQQSQKRFRAASFAASALAPSLADSEER